MERFVCRNEARANAILDEAKEVIKEYGVVTREDLANLCGIPTRPRDDDFGWDDNDLDGAVIHTLNIAVEAVIVLPNAHLI